MNIFPFVKKEEKKEKDTLLIPLSDMHSGGSTALFPGYHILKDGVWKFKNTHHRPTAKQTKMYEHFIRSAEYIREIRRDRRLIVVVNGDAIEGVHHNTVQVVTNNEQEQQLVHVFLMNQFLDKIGFNKNKGDLLYYVAGTEDHTGDSEDFIATELGAELPPFAEGSSTFDFLPLEVNGKLVWFMHQGPVPGRGINLGDSVRLWLRHRYFELLEEGKRVPDLVAAGHYHIPVYNTFVRNYFTMHGMILPSFQMKTRYANRRYASEPERVGVTPIEIFANGLINVQEPYLMPIDSNTIKV